MRDLSDQEKELTEKGITRLKSEVMELAQNLEYNRDLLKKQNYLRDFDDKWRDFLRKQKETEDKKVFDMIESEINSKSLNIEIMEKQIYEGVQEKENPENYLG